MNNVDMKKTAIAVGAAALSVGTMGLTAPAQSAPNEQIPNKQALAKRYLRAVCPVNRQNFTIADEWNAAGWPRRHDPPVGTPVPSGLRLAFQRASGASGRAVKIFKKGNWPDSLAEEYDVLVEFYVVSVPFYGSRDTSTVRKSWMNPDKLPDSRPAAKKMRRALGLPRAPKGCGGLG